MIRVLGCVATLFTLTACTSDPEYKGCQDLLCEDQDAEAEGCTPPRGSRLLLDGFGAAAFRLVPVVRSDGSWVTPALFEWRAQADADMVVCAVLLEPPEFACTTGDRPVAIANFERAAVVVDVWKFSKDEPREGTFDLVAARLRRHREEPLVWVAGCWAYTLTEVTGATALIEVPREGLPPELQLPETCSGSSTHSCYDRVADRPGRCFEGECAAVCSERVGCPINRRCDERGRCVPSEEDAGT